MKEEYTAICNFNRFTTEIRIDTPMLEILIPVIDGTVTFIMRFRMGEVVYDVTDNIREVRKIKFEYKYQGIEEENFNKRRQ